MNFKHLSILFLVSIVAANEAANEHIDLPVHQDMPAVDKNVYDISVQYPEEALEVKENPEFFFVI